MDNANANHANATTQRTASERVKMPASADQSHKIDFLPTLRRIFRIPRYRDGVIAQFFYMSGAARKNISPTAPATCPPVSTDASASTNSHGALGALMPVPEAYDHDVVAV